MDLIYTLFIGNYVKSGCMWPLIQNEFDTPGLNSCLGKYPRLPPPISSTKTSSISTSKRITQAKPENTHQAKTKEL